MGNNCAKIFFNVALVWNSIDMNEINLNNQPKTETANVALSLIVMRFNENEKEKLYEAL